MTAFEITNIALEAIGAFLKHRQHMDEDFATHRAIVDMLAANVLRETMTEAERHEETFSRR